jgi:23S rRNA (pseudouridine1915-N3)-methyltransferase
VGQRNAPRAPRRLNREPFSPRLDRALRIAVKLLIIAVGSNMPPWVDTVVADYVKRMGRALPLELVEIRAQARARGAPAARAQEQEAARIRAALPRQARMIVLDEHGTELTTRELALRLERWMQDGRDVAFIIGGADGLDRGLKTAAGETLRLSALTLPHALVRVLLAEQLYRAMSLLKNHPYHRE